MKPDALLGISASTISVSEAKRLGYFIPDSFHENSVPKINFSTVDAVMKICCDNGLGLRAHTLIWHSQTPDWFFRIGWGYGNYVSQSEMDARMEFYIKTVMNHVYSSQYGKCVYAWDIANEYLNAKDSGWKYIYGGRTTRPDFLKKAFQYAHDCLDYYGLSNSVSLFYNDYNTYMNVNDVISLINYINSSHKNCPGIGMQSHLQLQFPSVDSYISAMKSFLNAGFEVQVTELDLTNNNEYQQASYIYNLMKQINQLKKNGGKITGITVWGLGDNISWIDNGHATLDSYPGSPKQSYYKMLEAYKDVFGSIPQPTPQPSSAYIKDGWYYIKNVGSQKYLQVENSKGNNAQNVIISGGNGNSGQIWKVTNTQNGTISITSLLGNFNLDVANSKDANETNIQIYTAHGQAAQQFTIKQTSQNGVYGILTKVSNGSKGLDVYRARKDDGTNVQEYSFYGNANQLWQFESTGW